MVRDSLECGNLFKINFKVNYNIGLKIGYNKTAILSYNSFVNRWVLTIKKYQIPKSKFQYFYLFWDLVLGI